MFKPERKKITWKEFVKFQTEYSNILLPKKFGQSFCKYFGISEDNDPVLYNTGSEKTAKKIIFEYYFVKEENKRNDE